MRAKKNHRIHYIYDDDDDKTHFHVSDPIFDIVTGTPTREKHIIYIVLVRSLCVVQIIIHSLVNTTLSHIFHGNNIFPNKVIQFQ